ncbi:S-layer homology domain-containing protein [Paenibacillus harenae]|uniref:rhamnogalacturonan lyase family protein n=1 Tax=Paenibacillus harenae TaxID=306543 RepID=UPI0003F94F43|nr:S-layer homology domain-containing protein [Paenibacillus harenae]
MPTVKQKPFYALVSKLLVCVLLASLVAPWGPLPAYAADAVLVDDDFGSYESGELTIGSGNTWTKEGAAPMVNIVPATVTESTYAEIVNKSTGSSYFGQRFAAQSGGLIVEFDVNLPASSGGTLWVMDGKVNATNAAVLRYQLDGGVIKRHNAAAENQIKYDSTHWYRFKMVFNVPQKKSEVYIKDLTTGTEVLWADGFYSGRSRISSFGFYVNPNGGQINLANVRVTSLDTNLSSLALSAGSYMPGLSPAFTPSVSNYTVDVPYWAETLSVVPTASYEEGVSLKVGQEPAISGEAVQISLGGSGTDIDVTVTSNVYTNVAKTYTVSVNRLEKAPNVNFVATEGHDGKVLIGWEKTVDPAFIKTNVYLVQNDQSLMLADTVEKGHYMAAVDGLDNDKTYQFVVKGVYRYEGEEPVESIGVTVSETPKKLPARQMEYLNRGLVAIKESNSVFVSWRLLGTDPADIAFNLYRDGKRVNARPITDSTNYVDSEGTADSAYTVRAVIGGSEKMETKLVSVWDTEYLTIPLRKPEGGVTLTGEEYSYRANDASVGDLDGDGEYEIVLKWDPTNSKDNSQSGYTGNTLVDAYKLDGTFLWRIDLGRNIRAGAHYLDVMVYDLDGDGKAEVTFRTADGTVDGQGNVIGDENADYRNSNGYILSGPEYHTVFEGATGKALATEDYEPARGNVNDWGDNYGNRVDRFLAAIAYLDGVHPSVVMQRGYYTRMVLVAYDWRDGKLTKRWTFDSNTPGNEGFAGQGNHQLSVADVDNDGKDEIITGAAAIDDDGTALWNSRLGHGDAMHLGDLDPNRLGLELFAVQEDTSVKYSADMKDARSGRVLWGQLQTGVDTGRGLTADIDPRSEGEEAWAIDGAWNSTTGGLFSAAGERIAQSIPSSNFAIWWDGDLSRELFDHEWLGDPLRAGIPKIDKWDYNNNKLVNIERFTGTYSNNDTKGNPVLQADLLGDWREELVLRTEDSQALRIYATTRLTDKRIYTLMQDPIYRLGVAWQNTGYNQPPHTGFYLGTGMDEPAAPNIYTVSDSPDDDGGSEEGGKGGITVPDTGDKKVVSFKASEIQQLIAAAKDHRLVIDVTSHTAAEVQVKLPAQELRGEAISTIGTVEIRFGSVIYTVDAKWLQQKIGAPSSEIVFSMKLADLAALSDKAKQKLNGSAAYDLQFLIDGKSVENFGNALTVKLAYALKAGENPNQIVVYHISEKGELSIVKNGKYDAAAGMATFKPGHFSIFAAAQSKADFTDIASVAWAKDSIESLAAKGIVNGMGSGSFEPNGKVTRAEFVKMLMYAFDLSSEAAESSFTDAVEGAWYYSSIAAAQELGIVQGNPDGSFGAGDQITREEMAVITYRTSQYLKLSLETGTDAEGFVDQSAIAAYAAEAIRSMQANGVIEGLGEGIFGPKGLSTRAQAAVVIDRLLHLN